MFICIFIYETKPHDVKCGAEVVVIYQLFPNK